MLQAATLHNESELLLEVARGNTVAFRTLYDFYKNKLYGYSYSLTKSHVQSEDILQEVFLKIWLNREELGKIDSFNAYLFSMIKYRIFNILKQSYQQSIISQQLATEMPVEDNSTENHLEYTQLQTKVHTIIERLPPQQKNVYLLSRDRGMKQKDIANSMGITVTTVKKHLTLALQFIRRNLDITIIISLLLRK